MRLIVIVIISNHFPGSLQGNLFLKIYKRCLQHIVQSFKKVRDCYLI